MKSTLCQFMKIMDVPICNADIDYCIRAVLEVIISSDSDYTFINEYAAPDIASYVSFPC